MPQFEYKARGPRGDAITGVLEATDPDGVAARLMEGGLTPVNISPQVETGRRSGDIQQLFPHTVGLADLILFSRQMHSLLRAGVPILRSLSGLAGSSRNPALATALNDARQSLEAGRDLATALSIHPRVFSQFYVSLIRVGETSGQLPEVFQQLAFYLEREKRTRDQIKSALRYPTFVLVAIAIAITIINIWVIPAFAWLFARFGADLPWATSVLIAMSNFMINHWELLLTGILAGIVGIRMYVKTDNGRYRWDKLKLRLPLAGEVIYQATLARFTRVFALGMHSGVPLITSLSVVSGALDNRFVEERVLNMREGIERGNSISQTAAGTGIFDPLVLQMLTVGEESGSLDELLKEIAEYYDREVSYAIDKLSASIEPVLTIVVGLMVLVLALGVFLPMWDLGKAAMGN